MNPDSAQLLSRLQDIHSAGPPSWWPPAPGWWAVALVLLVIGLLVLKRGLGWMAARRRRRAWLQALDAIARQHDPLEQPHQYLAGINRLFRAVALKAFPGTACARLQGEEWVAFIAALLPRPAGDSLQVLASGPYESLPQFDADALDQCARTWVNTYG